MRVRRLAGWAAVAAVALATGCTGGSGDDPPAVSVGILEPRGLLPADVAEPDAAQVLAALFSPLVVVDADGRPVPVAAEAVTSPDNQVWTIRLRAGYRFHNGEPVTADHYLAAWNYAAYGPNRQARSYLFSGIKGYAALQGRDPDDAGPAPAAEPRARALAGLAKVDERTLRVTLLQPFGDFPAMLANPAFYPLPAAAWQSPGVLRPGFEDAPVGNGPFRMDGVWRRGSGIQVRRFDGFPGARPKVAGVEFRIYKRLSTAYTQVLSGDLDVVTAIPAERALTAADDLSGRLYRAPGSVVQLLAFPVVEHDFSDARVRRAISMAIDRDAMVGASSGPEHEPARSFVAPVVPGHRPQGCGEACRYDPTAARRLYAAAGGPAQLQIAYNADGRHQPWVDALCAQLTANLGVRCAGVTQPTFGGLLAAVQTHALTCPFRLSWEMAYPSMESYLGPLYTSTGAANYPGYRNADFDDLIRQAAAARSPAESIRRYQQAEDLLAADMPAIPLRFSRTMVGYSAAVRDVRTDRAGRVDLVAIDRTR